MPIEVRELLSSFLKNQLDWNYCKGLIATQL